MSKPVKAVTLTVAIAVAVVVLFLYVFPWVEAQQQDPTLGAPVTTITGPVTTIAALGIAPQEQLPQLVRSPR